MLTTAENELLCRVESDAPMGRLMRRHWIPAALSEQLREPDGTPIRLRLLGEDLVAFRDTQGRLGVLGEACPHRKASLALGRNEECGLRCLYHGWKVDVDGNIVEMPSEPPRRLPPKTKHKAYPVREAGGFVWVYMGPAEKMPEFEAPPWAPTPEAQISIVRIDVDCNWAQIMEGQIDSAHSSTLHSSDMKPAPVDTATAGETWLRPSTDRSPRIQVELTNYGMRYAAIRQPIKNPDTHDYVRITTYVAPFIALIPPNSSFNVAVAVVPRDDTTSCFNFIAWSEDGAGGIDQEAWRKFSVAQIGIDVDEHYRPIRTRANNYLQDRQAMKSGNFTGIRGIPNQDIAMWESIGPIADRTNERLGASDIAIVQFRRLMIAAAQSHAEGGPPIGLMEPRVPQAKLRSFQGMVPKSDNWRTFGASQEELALRTGIEEDDTERDMAGAAA
jgi:phthalate 4,5-dioxygenase oxygenase subunit